MGRRSVFRLKIVMGGGGLLVENEEVNIMCS